MLKPAHSVKQVLGIGPKKADLLSDLKIETVKDLLFWFPRKYIDCTKPQPISELRFGMLGVVLAEVKNVHQRRSRSRKLIIEALLEDESGTIEAIWFNQPYIENVLQRTKRALFFGPVRYHYQNRRLVFTAPKIEKDPKIIPIYSQTAGITSRQFNKLVTAIQKDLQIADHLTAEIRRQADVIELSKALSKIHNPLTMADVLTARRRLLFDEIFSIQLKLAQSKKERQKKNSNVVKKDIEILKKFSHSLPFQMTDDQKKAIWVMSEEMTKKDSPMHRLLNGDVGSGKTLVAVALMLLAQKSGFRSALMAPTEILAIQHYKNISQLLNPFSIKVGLVTRNSKELSADVLVGTHALISKQVKLSNVALVVIDEQHRFGVDQRRSLISKCEDSKKSPHFLSLTATPIPRSLALTFFGDLDVSLLREKPSNRKKIKTVVKEGDEKLWPEISKTVAKGEQVYVICPLVEEQVGDNLVTDERKSVADVYKKLRQELDKKIKIDKIHGQLSSVEKERVLANFKDQETDVLVATSVVEVGMDIPQATMMIIENAERFGVSQLHQLRGRIGRSDLESTCYLHLVNPTDKSRRRCAKVATCDDGFELARFDLAERGPGELVGQLQKGINPLFSANLDIELIKKAQDIARSKVGV